MENQLRTAVGIFLPPRKLVVDRQRHAFFEALACVGGQAEYVPTGLETQRHVEVFAHRGFRPIFFRLVLEVRDVLDCCPTQEGVVSHEGRHISVADGVLDCAVDKIREECDTLLEPGCCNVHHT